MFERKTQRRHDQGFLFGPQNFRCGLIGLRLVLCIFGMFMIPSLVRVHYLLKAVAEDQQLGQDGSTAPNLNDIAVEMKPHQKTEYSNWSTRLAIQRATNARTYPFNVTKKNGMGRVAVLVQVGYAHLWEEMVMCAANVAVACLEGYDVGLYVAVLDTYQDDDVLAAQMKYDLDRLPSIETAEVDFFPNQGADIGMFTKQLRKIVEAKRTYDYVLKMHTKRDHVWRNRGIESLCGTPEQVNSVLHNFLEDPEMEMIAPFGTTFQATTPGPQIFPHISRKYEWGAFSSAEGAFDELTVTEVKRLHGLVHPNTDNMLDGDIAIIAGSMFWARFSALFSDKLVAALPEIEKGFTKGYTVNLATEHFLERLIPSEVFHRGSVIAELAPAPRVLALFFPQFHQFPENDRFWGEGFTEWTLLRPLNLTDLKKPLEVQMGGLGYYDLLDREVRRRQGEMARDSGMAGFVYYHYWFSGNNAPEHHKVMYRMLEQMLEDGEPNMPFALSWANEPWTRRWTGETGEEELLSQSYGDKEEWEEHFNYLVRFFDHPNYIRIQGKPVFIIYRVGHVGDKLKPMIELWRSMAIEYGLPGLHVIHTIGNFYRSDSQTSELAKNAGIDGSFHFWPQLLGGGFRPKGETASTEDFHDVRTHVQYWGAFTGFDRRPRDAEHRPILHRSVNEFGNELSNSFSAMTNSVKREVDINLYFITAWNEWNEQAVLEPDYMNKFGYLDALKSSLQSIPAKHFSPHRTCRCVDCDTDKRCGRLWTGSAVIQEEKKKPFEKITVLLCHCDQDLRWLGDFFEGVKVTNIILTSVCNSEPTGLDNLAVRITRVKPEYTKSCHYTYVKHMNHMYTKSRFGAQAVVFMSDKRDIRASHSGQMRSLKDMLDIASKRQFACGLEPLELHNLSFSVFHDTDVLKSFSLRKTVDTRKFKRRQKIKNKAFESIYTDFGEFLNHRKVVLPERITEVCYGDRFVASRWAFQQHPKDLWDALERSIGRRKGDLEEAHFMERLWAALLSHSATTPQVYALQRHSNGQNTSNPLLPGALAAFKT